MMKIFKLTMLFIGAIIGAGFATGAELITFFGALALPYWLIASLIGLTLFLVMAGTIYLQSCQKLRFTKTINYILVAVYFILLTAMTAGTSQIGGVATSSITLLFSALIVKFGFKKMAQVNTLIVVAIVIVLLGICLPYQVFTIPQKVNWVQLPHGIVMACLYAGLNCFMFPELIAAAHQQNNSRHLYGAALGCALIISLFAYMILTTITVTGTQTATMPLLATSHHFATSIVILLAIVTSQYSALFAITQKLTQIIPATTPQQTNIMLFGCCCGAFGASFLGFKRILSFGYPLIGGFTCFFLLFSWWQSLREQHRS